MTSLRQNTIVTCSNIGTICAAEIERQESVDARTERFALILAEILAQNEVDF